ncbi:hypothetical protein NM688_g4239 [Phlebia brevispora]|uniref:Uncharacterized protein n=1 Tax=Phlebia brevispora TaxID=194682 RepID=A0ACC1T3L7_9APHY|nr:hypothetical protein NM688_g4239 [Phlebia brevispora]
MPGPAATAYGLETWLQGALLASIAYGTVVTLCFQTFVLLIQDRKKSSWLRQGTLLAYVALTFILSTIFQGASMRLTQDAFVEGRNLPGGPSPADFPVPIDVCNYVMVILTFLSDALLLWRCTIMSRNSIVPDWVSTVVALAAWLTELIIGVLFLVRISHVFIFDSDPLTLGFFCYSLVLNVLATAIIVGRLFVYRRRFARVWGSEHVTQYTGIMAMMVESELLYTAFLILFIVPYIMHNLLESAFLQSLALVQATAALMIVYRVAQGKGWTKDTHAQIATGHTRASTIQFNTVSTARATGSTTVMEELPKSMDDGAQGEQGVCMGEDGAKSV